MPSTVGQSTLQAQPNLRPAMVNANLPACASPTSRRKNRAPVHTWRLLSRPYKLFMKSWCLGCPYRLVSGSWESRAQGAHAATAHLLTKGKKNCWSRRDLNSHPSPPMYPLKVAYSAHFNASSHDNSWITLPWRVGNWSQSVQGGIFTNWTTTS